VFEINKAADNDEHTLRISMDTKDKVKIGEFSRNGKSRVEVKAADHDFCGESVVPFGILLPESSEVNLYISNSRVTADFMADCLQDFLDKNESRFQGYRKIVLNQDNGPENNSHRTQFIKRMVEFSAQTGLEIQLAYYPPYHSKYNPVERVWGVLETHWNGDLLDSKETVVNFAETMTWNGKNPIVNYVDKAYESGKKLTKKAMAAYEAVIDRLTGLEKWFVTIKPDKARQLVLSEKYDELII
jgi:hypothetical protein